MRLPRVVFCKFPTFFKKILLQIGGSYQSGICLRFSGVSVYYNSKTGERIHAPFPPVVVNDVNYAGNLKAFLWRRQYFDAMSAEEFNDAAVAYTKSHPFQAKKFTSNRISNYLAKFGGCREIDSPMNRGDDAYVSSPPLKINEKKKKDG